MAHQIGELRTFGWWLWKHQYHLYATFTCWKTVEMVKRSFRASGIRCRVTDESNRNGNIGLCYLVWSECQPEDIKGIADRILKGV